MKRELLRKRLPVAVLLLAAVLWTGTNASAQDYGVGETVNVPQAPGTTPIDGIYEADFWDTGATLDLLASKSFWSEDYPEPDDMAGEARLLYRNDSLYVYVTISGDEVFFNGRGADHILMGIDPVHEAGTTDMLVDQDDWAGWPENAPEDGPYAYVIYGGENGGIFLSDGTNAVDEGWVRGEVWSDEENNAWGVEAVAYVPTVETGAEIGFNIGGSTTTEAIYDDLGDSYGYFSRWSVENPGGDIMSLTSSYGTLRMGFGGEGYGSGVTLQVPRVEPGEITIDGNADEEAWEHAQSDIDVTANWNSYGWGAENAAEADLIGETKLLWSDDTLYVHHQLFDPILYWQDDNWGSDMILIGIDNSLEGDSLFGPNFDGGIHNAPEGVYTYFINPNVGFTFAWSDSVAQRNPGTVNAEVFADEDNNVWGLEAAIYVPAIQEGAQIGFDIGGAQASQEAQDSQGFGDYAYYAWQSGTGGGDPGAINRDASLWATLTMVQSVAIEDLNEVPTDFTLEQNYPNPFNPATTIEFAITRPGNVTVDVYNMLGKKVATLVDEAHSTGTYRMTWNAAGFASGIYMYQLRVDGQLVDTKSMTLLK